MKFLTLMLLFSLTTPAFSCTEDGTTGIVPENNLKIPVNARIKTGISEEQFNDVISKIEAIYSPVVSGMGGNLRIARKWTDGTVNANAMRSGSNWNVNMYGGLARHEAITSDGFALVLCHEIGHHIGGAPKINSLFGFNKWASNEGQSDYFATLKCLRRAFLNDDNISIVKGMSVPASLSTACAEAHPGAEDTALCIRNGMAGDSVARLFAALSNSKIAQFDTPDTKVVSKTNNSHPATQCRLDTYFQGALCEKSMNEDVSQKDEVQGTCHGSTGQTSGLRSLCWFKPSK